MYSFIPHINIIVRTHTHIDAWFSLETSELSQTESQSGLLVDFPVIVLGRQFAVCFYVFFQFWPPCRSSRLNNCHQSKEPDDSLRLVIQPTRLGLTSNHPVVALDWCFIRVATSKRATEVAVFAAWFGFTAVHFPFLLSEETSGQTPVTRSEHGGVVKNR